MSKPLGHQIELTRVTPYGLTVVLDNGVQVQLCFNQNQLYLNLSGVELNDHSLEIRELAEQGKAAKLSNCFAVNYTPAAKVF